MTQASKLVLHPLRSRSEGMDTVILGRPETGEFVAVPPIAVDIIELLGQGLSVGEVQGRLRHERGIDLDVAEFVTELIELGFVAKLDGREIARSAPSPVSFSWVQPQRVRWLLSPWVAICVGLLVLAGASALVMDPRLLPGYRDLVWHPLGGVVLAGNVALTWSIIFLHELGHLFTARAAGPYGRMSLTTRLQFLAAQTDVSGIWVEPRRVRVTVYLAGIAVNLALAATGLLIRATTAEGGLAYRIAGLVVLISLLLVLPQIAFFMRTDLYFLLQDLTGCHSLYADGASYLWYQVRRVCRRAGKADDSSAALPARERQVVRWYSLLLVVGTAACLLGAVVVTYPAILLLLSRALHTLVTGGTPVALADAVITIVVVALLQGLWLRVWWRRHGHRLRGLWRRARPQ